MRENNSSQLCWQTSLSWHDNFTYGRTASLHTGGWTGWVEMKKKHWQLSCCKPSAVNGYLSRKAPERGRYFFHVRCSGDTNSPSGAYSLFISPLTVSSEAWYFPASATEEQHCVYWCCDEGAGEKGGQGFKRKIVQRDPKSEQEAQNTGRHCMPLCGRARERQ